MFFRMVKEGYPVGPWFSEGFGQTLGQTGSTSFFWELVRSNLGQPQEIPVKPSWGKLGATPVGSETAGQLLGKCVRTPFSNLVMTSSELGRILGNVFQTPLRLFGVMSPRRNRPTWFGLPRFGADTRENPGGTAKNLPQFACHSLSDALAVNRLTHGSKVKVGFRFLVFSQNSTFPTSAFSFPSSSDLALRNPNTLRGDLTWGLPKLQIEWSNGLEFESKHVEGGEFESWGLPKSQIGWFNGLESQSKHVEGCKSGGSTVWNLSPNRLRGDLTWGLPKLQIEWFNGLESQSKQVEEVILTWGLPKLQIGWFNGLESQSKQVEGCKSGGSTVWNLSPNRLRGDLTWGLPKLQIGWFNGLESQSKQVEEVILTWGLPKLQIEMSHRGSGSGDRRRSSRLGFLCHASSIEVVVALSAGSECTRLGFESSKDWVGLSDALDHLVGRHFLNLRSVRLKPSILSTHIPDGGSHFLDLWSRHAAFEGKSREKVLNIFQGFLASGLTGGLEGEMNFIGHGAKWTVPFMRYDLLKESDPHLSSLIGPSRLGNMFSRTIIYLDVAAAGSSIDSLTNTAPLSSPSRSFKSCAPWELVLSEPVLADSKVLFAICSTNAIRAGMSTILFVFTASSTLSSTRIKFHKELQLQTHYSIEVWVLQGIDEDLDHLFLV
uniref:Uncharacterized protein n=1 Tax=Fagus sylvatica TaxID=28930 RepID=A0A2N9G6Y7_FAGSY